MPYFVQSFVQVKPQLAAQEVKVYLLYHIKVPPCIGGTRTTEAYRITIRCRATSSSARNQYTGKSTYSISARTTICSRTSGIQFISTRTSTPSSSTTRTTSSSTAGTARAFTIFITVVFTRCLTTVRTMIPTVNTSFT